MDLTKVKQMVERLEFLEEKFNNLWQASLYFQSEHPQEIKALHIILEIQQGSQGEIRVPIEDRGVKDLIGREIDACREEKEALEKLFALLEAEVTPQETEDICQKVNAGDIEVKES